MPISIVDLPRLAGFEATNSGGDVRILDVSHTTNNIPAESLFCCVRGASADGHDFAAEALGSGAVALMVDRLLPIDAPQLRVADVRRCMALSAAAVHGFPSHELQVVGITGTNGKTTTAYMLGAILSAADVRNQVAGTLSGVRTTPEATDLQRALRSWHEDGGQAYVMEVSSHALHQDRVLGTRFAVGIFTNLGIDHLDYHGTVEAYFAAKARLFTTGMTDRAVINRDDVHGQQLLDVLGASAVAFGLSDATDVVVGPDSVRFTWSGVAMHLPMGGTFNLANALGAATAARELGIGIDAIADGLSSMRPVRGRLEPVANDRGIVVLVDYAHTADALDRVLTSVRTSMGSQGKLTVVFGCGGDRDASKRGPMGAVASQLADRVILTADNSRSEDTSSIIDQIMAGISAKKVAAPVTQILDREEAIAEAIAASVRGDVVVIAGKGHETTQEIAGLVTEFDDAAVARRILGAGK